MTAQLFIFFLGFFSHSRPLHLQSEFIFPDAYEKSGQTIEVSSDSRVRVAGSFDTDWPTRGTGRSYDSLSGWAGFLGLFSGNVMS